MLGEDVTVKDEVALENVNFDFNWFLFDSGLCEWRQGATAQVNRDFGCRASDYHVITAGAVKTPLQSTMCLERRLVGQVKLPSSRLENKWPLLPRRLLNSGPSQCDDCTFQSL